MRLRWYGQSAFALVKAMGKIDLLFVPVGGMATFDTDDVAPEGGRIVVVPAPLS